MNADERRLDLTAMATAAVEKIVASGKIEAALESAVEAAVIGTVKDQLTRYSDFGKQLAEAVGRALKLYGDIEIESYNDAILKIVAAQLQAQTHAIIQQQVAERMKELLEPAPEEITLSKLVETFVAFVRDKQDSGCVCYGDEHAVSVHYDPREERDSFATIYLDEDAGKSSRECEMQIGLHKGEVYHLRLRNRDVEREIFAGPFYGFQQLLFQMRVARTKVVIDCDVHDLDLSYSPEYA